MTHTVYVVTTEQNEILAIFDSMYKAMKSIAFSCHKLEGEVTFERIDGGRKTKATQPNGEFVYIVEHPILIDIQHI